MDFGLNIGRWIRRKTNFSLLSTTQKSTKGKVFPYQQQISKATAAFDGYSPIHVESILALTRYPSVLSVYLEIVVDPTDLELSPHLGTLLYTFCCCLFGIWGVVCFVLRQVCTPLTLHMLTQASTCDLYFLITSYTLGFPQSPPRFDKFTWLDYRTWENTCLATHLKGYYREYDAEMDGRLGLREETQNYCALSGCALYENVLYGNTPALATGLLQGWLKQGQPCLSILKDSLLAQQQYEICLKNYY